MISRDPIPMILYCPVCGLQHIDNSEVEDAAATSAGLAWDNPPHRSHLCARCGCIWRPADVPTTGVLAIKTAGKNDNFTSTRRKEEVIKAARALLRLKIPPTAEGSILLETKTNS